MFKATVDANPINIAGIVQPKINSFLHNQVGKYVQDYLKEKIRTQIDSKGNNMPVKKDSTKRQYNKNGWDTEHWFVRTGESTVLKQKNSINAVDIYPTNVDNVLNYHHDKAPIFYMSEELASKLDVLISNYFKGI